jgi:hypothetical protein
MEGGSKKRRRTENSYHKAYAGVKFCPIPSTGRPGTPHRYFKESYRVDFADGGGGGEESASIQQVVHTHVNGLVIVTAGTSLPKGITSVDCQASAADVASQSAATKRKQQAKMLKGKNVKDSVGPSDQLATLKLLDTDATVQLRCCVWGSIIEINPNLSPQNVQDDPLLDGYLAVILPSGPFPPHDLSGAPSDKVPKPTEASSTSSDKVEDSEANS